MVWEAYIFNNRNEEIKKAFTNNARNKSLDEICEGIKSVKNRQIALQYVVDILSLSGDDDKNIGFLKDLVSRLSFNSENVDNICNYYRIVKKKNLVFQTIKEVSEKEECNV